MGAKHSERYAARYNYLLALKLGEYEEFPIKPTSAEKRLHTPRYKRERYVHYNNVIQALLAENPHIRFTLRIGDWDNPKTVDTVRIYCTQIGDEKFTVPPTKGGFRQVVIAHEKKLEAAAELPAQIEQARDAAKPVAHDPPNLIKITKDHQLKLIELVQAHARGDQIQVHNGSKWVDTNEPDWMLPVARLRIAPPPRRELWALFSRDGGSFMAKLTRAEFKDADQSLLVRYREVLPGDDDEE